MLDINRLRSDFDSIAKRISTRNKDYPALLQYQQYDQKWRKLTTKIQELNTERNLLTEQVGKLIKDKNIDEANKIRSKVQKIKSDISEMEIELQDINAQLDVVLHSIPNVPHESVPVGKDEKDNPEIRK
jgi:seryl-tRNA synthetase